MQFALTVPCMVDRAMQALHLLALEPVSETCADSHSYGFRRDRSTADAIEQCFTALAKKTSSQWILEGDIRACFDEISHSWLVTNVPTDTVILQKWLKAGYIEDRQLFPTNAGTPQGGIISPAISNWALDGLQHRLAERFVCRRVDGKWIRPKVGLVRYADDFVITGYSRELLEDEVKPLVETFLMERGLTLSPEKTRITHISQGFDFLGQNIRKYQNGKLLIKPSKRNVQTFLTKVRTVIKGNVSADQVGLIGLLNPIIDGWANFHRHVVSKKVYSAVDTAIWQALWRWCCRRHPCKGARWIRARYFHREAARHWVFAADTGELTAEGKPRRLKLRKASDVPIRRHTQVRGNANPFDPAWESYFEDRYGLKMANALSGRGKLIRLWLDQERACIVCQQRITAVTGWHIHHIVRRVDGGCDAWSNLVMVHPDCHRQIHSRGLTVMKPAPKRGL